MKSKKEIDLTYGSMDQKGVTMDEDRAVELINYIKSYYVKNIAPRGEGTKNQEKRKGIKDLGEKITSALQFKNPVEDYQTLKEQIRSFFSVANSWHQQEIQKGGVTGLLSWIAEPFNGNSPTQSTLEKLILELSNQLNIRDGSKEKYYRELDLRISSSPGQ